jgi:hypothetical protein
MMILKLTKRKKIHKIGNLMTFEMRLLYKIIIGV